LDPENHQFLVEILPTLIWQGRTVHLLEGNMNLAMIIAAFNANQKLFVSGES